ncbi:hypothetical protein C8N40_102511 [Pontibacter mucosus]|uniref:DUF5666 domain-containing protein n=1 Tax=Pontibacter mucosus TaxID=1649266 RepID=A0A2T5YQD9_9BACT|nr:hypothetical protein [Pontibacter mucosus]PTX21535.1 hypothetical protein C8N40_102511 [Pontibacter mucosus]
MKTNNLNLNHLFLTLLGMLLLAGCQTATGPANASGETETRAYKSMAPERVDIRGRVLASHYSDGQVVLEVEALAPSVDSRYQRAYVLVQPTAQKVGLEGQPISISELHQGQNVAILLRGGGRGTIVGVGVARKLWVEEPFP